MIIKSHIRGGYRAVATYLKDVGANESTRLVHVSDPDARNVDEAFRNMWLIGRSTRARKPLHHVSINPMKDERLTDEQVLRICTRLEEKYSYKPGNHQRLIVEHVKDGRQHFHVMWHRVSLASGHVVWPGHHWKKSKQAAREMEAELDLKRPAPRRARSRAVSIRQKPRGFVRAAMRPAISCIPKPPQPTLPQLLRISARHHRRRDRAYATLPMARRPAAAPEMSVDELIAWAWKNRRADILARFGIYVSFSM